MEERRNSVNGSMRNPWLCDHLEVCIRVRVLPKVQRASPYPLDFLHFVEF